MTDSRHPMWKENLTSQHVDSIDCRVCKEYAMMEGHTILACQICGTAVCKYHPVTRCAVCDDMIPSSDLYCESDAILMEGFSE